jgi:nicotinamide-nucleotide amidase
MSGASDYFIGGVVAYSEKIKDQVLGVSARTLAKYGAVSRETAEEMALGVRRLYGSDYAIATTGIAGPAGDGSETPVGTVWIAVATPEGVSARKFIFGGLRRQNIDRATATAINMLRLILRNKPSSE